MQFLRRTRLWIIALPIFLIALGALCNQAVLIANHDRFPVLMNNTRAEAETLHAAIAVTEAAGPALGNIALHDGMIDDTHCVMTSKTHLNWLADIWDFHDAIYSIGDGLLELGYWLLGFSPLIWAVLVVKELKERC